MIHINRQTPIIILVSISPKSLSYFFNGGNSSSESYLAYYKDIVSLPISVSKPVLITIQVTSPYKTDVPLKRQFERLNYPSYYPIYFYYFSTESDSPVNTD